jgi:hypothetical protein
MQVQFLEQFLKQSFSFFLSTSLRARTIIDHYDRPLRHFDAAGAAAPAYRSHA